MEQKNPNNVTQKVPTEKLKDIQIISNGQQKTANGSKVILNGIELGKGIKRVELVLEAQKHPEVTIEYGTRLIPKEVCESLGLK